jgi:HK97 family phage major capsid protein
MEISEFVKKTEFVPLAELTTLAATRSCFGDDVLAAFRTQIELRNTEGQKVLDTAAAANREALLASEQRSFDGYARERDALLSLQLAIEKRSEARAYVPESQRQAPAMKKSGRLFGLELRALAESSGPGAIIAPDAWGPGFFDLLAAQSVALRSGIRVIRTDRDVVHVPHIVADPAAAWTAEGAPIAPSDPNYADVVATPRKLATLQVISNELIADSNPDVVQLLETQVARALALKFDLGVFEGSGTPPEIKGLKNVAGIQTAALTGAITNLDAFAVAISALETANAHASAIVMAPAIWAALMNLKEATGSNKSLLQDSAAAGVTRALFGVPVFLTSQLPTNEAYIYDASQVVAVFRQDTTIVLDHSRLFNSDQSELRATMRADLVVPNPLAVYRLTGVTVP